MNRILIAATLSALMAACALEPTDTTPTDEQASSSSITPHACPVGWEGPGPYFICASAPSRWWHNQSVCTASCDSFCELIAQCNAACQCILN